MDGGIQQHISARSRREGATHACVLFWKSVHIEHSLLLPRRAKQAKFVDGAVHEAAVCGHGARSLVSVLCFSRGSGCCVCVCVCPVVSLSQQALESVPQHFLNNADIYEKKGRGTSRSFYPSTTSAQMDTLLSTAVLDFVDVCVSMDGYVLFCIG